MSLYENGLSAADVAAVTRNNNGGDGYGFGGGWGLWIIMIALLSMFGIGGFGGLGFGGFGGMFGGMGGWGGMNGGGFLGAEIQRGFAENNIIRKLDEQTYGLADATFALNNTMTQGFANAELSRANQQAALMQQLCAMQADFQKCCCETQRAIDGVNYNMATQTNNLQNTMCNNTRDIIEATNCGTRQILEALNKQRYEAKEAEVQSYRDQLFMATLRESQAKQDERIFSRLDPPAVPSYPACGPYGSRFAGGWGGWDWNGWGRGGSPCPCNG
ncbi:MAG: hypothetical protein IJ313_10605 [Clostridia bacterium]|nr:hypothetical protein [Clostridia bacterium]